MNKQNLSIAEPCHADWNAMTGGEQKRFCGSCDKHVHHLSAMTRREATQLMATEVSPCVRYAHDARTGEVLFAKRKVRATAPAHQIHGAAKLLASAALIATSLSACDWPQHTEHALMGAIAAPYAMPVDVKPTTSVKPQSEPTDVAPKPVVEPQVEPNIEPQIEPQIEMLGEIAPQPMPLQGAPEYMPHDALIQQEQGAVDHLQQFGVTLEEEEFEGAGEAVGCDGTAAPGATDEATAEDADLGQLPMVVEEPHQMMMGRMMRPDSEF